MTFSKIDSDAPQRVRISWEMLTPRDDTAGRPDEEQDGYWPSLDPEEDGYIGPADPSDVEGILHGIKFEEQHLEAQERIDAWERGDWHYVGVIARAHVYIPIGGRSFRMMRLDSGGLWGIESDAGEYLREVYQEQRDDLLAELRTFGAALGQLPDFDEEGAE